jgi:hypothetical protein
VVARESLRPTASDLKNPAYEEGRALGGPPFRIRSTQPQLMITAVNGVSGCMTVAQANLLES